MLSFPLGTYPAKVAVRLLHAFGSVGMGGRGRSSIGVFGSDRRVFWTDEIGKLWGLAGAGCGGHACAWSFLYSYIHNHIDRRGRC